MSIRSLQDTQAAGSNITANNNSVEPFCIIQRSERGCAVSSTVNRKLVYTIHCRFIDATIHVKTNATKILRVLTNKYYNIYYMSCGS